MVNFVKKVVVRIVYIFGFNSVLKIKIQNEMGIMYNILNLVIIILNN